MKMDVEDVLITENFDTICRTCLLQKKSLSLFSLDVANIIKRITNIEIETNDELPESICEDCIQQLKDIDAFIEKIINNHSLLMLTLEHKRQGSYHFDTEVEDEDQTIKPENEASDDSQYNFEHSETPTELPNIKEELSGTSDKDMEKALMERLEIKYCCSHCDKVVTSSAELAVHMKSHVGEKAYTCRYCGTSFSYMSSLNRHTRLHAEEAPYMCLICEKGYITASGLEKHMEEKHNIREDSSGEDDREDQSRSKKFKMLECPICHKMLHKLGYGTHMKMHTIEKKQFICSFCNKQFQKNSHLERHVRIHTGERPFTCEICDKSFRQDGDLKRHVSTHFDDKPFQCDECDKRFFTKMSLHAHKKTHTGVAKRINFKCAGCQITFDQHADYTAHRMANPECDRKYPCTTCGKSYSTSGSLKLHSRIHTGQSLFNCEICGKGFTARATLKIHTMIHTGETPFVCSYCSRGYNHSSALKKHIARNHAA